MLSNYKLYREATRVRKKSASCVQLVVAVQAIAKLDYTNKKLFMVNEFVAYGLGEALGLPVCLGTSLMCPIFHDHKPVAESPHWGSFSIAEEPPAADVDLLVENHPSMAAGIVAYDCWIGNKDRNDLNLHYDIVNREVFLFDHGQAVCNKFGPSYLSSVGLGFDMEHCIATAITSWEHFDHWFDRIEAIGDEYIRTIVGMTAVWDMSQAERNELADALIHRRSMIRKIFVEHQANRDVFQKISTLIPLEDKNDSIINQHTERSSRVFSLPIHSRLAKARAKERRCNCSHGRQSRCAICRRTRRRA